MRLKDIERRRAGQEKYRRQQARDALQVEKPSIEGERLEWRIPEDEELSDAQEDGEETKKQEQETAGLDESTQRHGGFRWVQQSGP